MPMHANAIAQGYETWWTKSLSWQFIIPLYFWTSAWKHENAFSILVGRALRCSFWRNSQKKKNKKKMRRLLSPRQLLRKKDHRSPPACVAAELKTFWDPVYTSWLYIDVLWLFTFNIHYLVHFSNPLQGGVHTPDSWKNDEKCWKRGTYISL